ncbi:MAG: SbcC/MukB-like Walker B domain-containing protein, partial [Bacilli bacterium]
AHARKLVRTEKETLHKPNPSNALATAFNQHYAALMDHHVSLASHRYDFESPICTDERAAVFLSEMEHLRERTVCTVFYRGQKRVPGRVLQEWHADLVRTEALLDDEDRNLFQEIFLNRIGGIIKERIRRAQLWVHRMDTLMQDRDTSSGLRLSIRWKPRTGEHEDEMDTAELVGLLQKDAALLSEQDLTKVTKHFRSKIRMARDLMQESGDSLHNVIRYVLDYRQWFRFLLSFEKPNEPKRELTDNAFFKFSGGEKAMSMYIPLFTAVYSRYSDAHRDAPYIISLDEAFAGVDETNIRDMFALVESLGFNYIMNSQALWGDYDSVPSLAIAELVRPKNADFVAVIRYHWDGKRKNLVTTE